MFLRIYSLAENQNLFFLLNHKVYGVPPAGLEPATRGLGNRRQFSYLIALEAICSYHCSYGVGNGTL
jgi:hypothetical protein